MEKTLLALENKNFYRHMAIPVQLSVEDDPKILKVVEHYRVESAKLYKPKVASLPEKELSEKEMVARIPKESLYVGAITCKRCHEVNYRNWLKTKHARLPRPLWLRQNMLRGVLNLSLHWLWKDGGICHGRGDSFLSKRSPM